MKKILTLLLAFTTSYLSAQTTIKGKLYCKNDGIGGISILAHKPGNINAVIAFDISQNDGSFSIKIGNTLDSVGITTRSINFKDTSVLVVNTNQKITLHLQSKFHDLKEVLIKANPIHFKKDTIVYNVGVFAKTNNKSIGDVINNMPGFEVMDNGAINYQGKKIEKYYIEGLDLLEGKYGIANKNLSHQAVKTVEVMQNHQPIKLLDTLVFSDKTSINIRLKRNISLAGQAKLGIGASPLLWEANISPMLFNKTQQVIASYQSNNIGEDIAQQLIPHYFSEMKNAPKEELLGIVPLTYPNIKKNRYLDNNIHMSTYNHIVKINDDSNLKINTSYVNDYQKQEGTITSNYFLKDDTITTHERSSNRITTDRLSADLIFNENSKIRFLKNKLSLRKQWDKSIGGITNNDQRISQQTKTPYSLMANHLKWIFPIRNLLVTFRSNISQNESPQILRVTPGAFHEIINSKAAYLSTEQNTKLNRLKTKNSLEVTFNKKNWHLDNAIGLEYDKNKLLSSLKADEIALPDQQWQNHLKWNYFSSYISECFRYETPNLNISLTIPLKNIVYDIKDSELHKKEEKKKTLLNPSFYLNYKINGNLTSILSFSKENAFGDIQSIHYGYLLSDYKTLTIRDLPIAESDIFTYRAQLKYTNPISSWFASLNLNQSKTTNNILISQRVRSDGSSEFNAIVKDNNNYQTTIYFKGSKLFYDLGSTLFFNSLYRFAKSQMQSNSFLTNIHSKYLLLEPRISISKCKWMNIDYKFQYAILTQEISSREKKFTNNNHILKMNLFPTPHHSLGLEFEHYKSQTSFQNKTKFANVNYCWKPKDTKMTLELRCVNLFNDDTMTSYYNKGVASIENTIAIRPRQFIFSVCFSL